MWRHLLNDAIKIIKIEPIGKREEIMKLAIDMKFKDYDFDNRIKRGLSEMGFVKPLEG